MGSKTKLIIMGKFKLKGHIKNIILKNKVNRALNMVMGAIDVERESGITSPMRKGKTKTLFSPKKKIKKDGKGTISEKQLRAWILSKGTVNQLKDSVNVDSDDDSMESELTPEEEKKLTEESIGF